MKTSIQTILTCVQEELKQMEISIKNPSELAEAATQFIKSAIQQIDESIISNGFHTLEEEIHFFKTEKPQTLASLFYHNGIYKLETFKPQNGKKEIKEYLTNKKVELKIFSIDNQEFYKYYQSGSTRFDPIYFVRGKFDIKTNITSMYLMVDERFCTYHCFLTAKILANSRLGVYIDNSLFKLKETVDLASVETMGGIPKDKFVWTGSKTELIELIYALVAAKVLNNGDMDLNKVVKAFEELFNTNLGQYSSTFIDIKKRKTGNTKFLDCLKDKLLQSYEDN